MHIGRVSGYSPPVFDGNEPRQPTLEEVDAELARTSQTASEGGQGLAPILPFDGGRFVNIVLFSRWPTAEMVFRLLTSTALVWFAVETSSWILGGIGVFIAVGSSINARYARIAQELRANIPAPHPSSVLDLPGELRREMLVAIAPIFATTRAPPEQLARIYARVIRGVWSRVLDAPPGPVAIAVLLLVYVSFVSLGVVLYMGSTAAQ